jgi:menaquinone-dependent protoporphyrinogen oxidase
MMRVLVTAATRHGSTEEICEAITAGLLARRIDAEMIAIDEVATIAGFDAVVLGSAVYVGHWLKPAREFAHWHAGALRTKPVWLFSSGPLGPPEKATPREPTVDVEEIVALTGAREHRVFAGRLDRARLSLAERAAVRLVHAPVVDSRDWDAVEAWAAEIAAVLSSPAVGAISGWAARAAEGRFATR